MKKLMAILLILALLLPYLGVLAEEVEREVLNCGDYKYSLLEDGTAEMPGTGEPLFPLGEDLRPYQPEIHGYFGHLPVRVTGENEAADCLLPVLVYGGGVFADAEALNDTVPGLDIREVDGDVYVTALSRELVFPADSPLARWTVGSRVGNAVVVEQEIKLSSRPWQAGGKLWLPLTDVAGLMGMDLRVAVCDGGQFTLLITPPIRSMLDVFADLASPTFRQMMIFSYPEECADAVKRIRIGSNIALITDQFICNLNTLEFSGDFRAMVTGVNFRPVILKIAGLEENELASLSGSLLDGLNTFIGVPGDTLMNPAEIRPVITAMQITSALMLDVGNMAITGEGAQAAYAARDQLAIDSLTFFSECAKGLYLDTEQMDQASAEIKKLRSSDEYATAAMDNSYFALLGDAAFSALALSGDSIGTTLSLIAGLYQLIEDAALARITWWSETMEKMEAFQDSLYGLMIEKEAEELLRDQMDAYMSRTEGVSSQANRDALLSSYLFLKSCLVTRRSALQALGRENSATAMEKETIDILTRDLTILTLSAADPDRCTPEAVIRCAISADQSAVLSIVRPYYIQMDGQVLQYGTWNAVHDTEISFSFGSLETGFISGTPDGYYRNICVPLGVPCLAGSDAEDELKARFSSPTVPGEDTVAITPGYGQHLEADTAYLRQTHTVEVTVTDSDGNRIADCQAVAIRQETDPAFRISEPLENAPETVGMNSAGTMTFRLPDGEYIIEVSAEAYADGSAPVSVQPDAAEPLPVHITLLDGCTVSGYVLDADTAEEALGFVNVTLTQGRRTMSMQTNGDPMTNTSTYGVSGRFAFDHVPYGTWQMTVHCPGYVDYAETLTLEEGRDEALQLNILLRPKGPYTGNLSQVLFIGHDLIAINADGTVRGAGYVNDNLYFYGWAGDYEGRRDYESWTGVRAIISSASSTPTGVTWSGQVLSERDYAQDWSDIRMVAICSNSPYEWYGLQNDGTVIHHVYETDRMITVPMGDEWTHVIQLVSYNDSLLGLRDDGTVACYNVGKSSVHRKIERWTDIICVGFCGVYAMGVKSNGTIVRCPIHSPNFRYGTYMDCLEWEDLVKITGNDRIIVGLTSDGHVLVSGPDAFVSEETRRQIAALDNIADVYCSRIGNDIFCITKDGSLLAFGERLTEFYPPEILDWTGLMVTAQPQAEP